MSDLKEQLIRLGSTDPDLRPQLRIIIDHLKTSSSYKVKWRGTKEELFDELDKGDRADPTIRSLSTKEIQDLVYHLNFGSSTSLTIVLQNIPQIQVLDDGPLSPKEKKTLGSANIYAMDILMDGVCPPPSYPGPHRSEP